MRIEKRFSLPQKNKIREKIRFCKEPNFFINKNCKNGRGRDALNKKQGRQVRVEK